MSSSSSSFMSMPISSSSSSTLLTQNEHHAFNAFLSTLAVSDVDAASIPGAGDIAGAEWQMYSQLGLPIPHAEGSDALAKATKDLIALHPPPKFITTQQQQQSHRPIAPAPGPSNLYLSPSTSFRNTAYHHSPPPDSRLHTPRPSPSKRPRTSSDCPTASTSSPPPPHTPKTTLLSAQQKKANHIQSEQKRRANIRRGYEALCETVPALQDAIRADDEGSGSGCTGPGAGGSSAGRRKRVKGEDGEKMDGRAGPRSESIVLQKTIEHIQSLLNDRSALMSRLDRVRMMLGPGHPLLYSDAYSSGNALWEREWDGGKGLMNVNGEEESDDE